MSDKIFQMKVAPPLLQRLFYVAEVERFSALTFSSYTVPVTRTEVASRKWKC